MEISDSHIKNAIQDPYKIREVRKQLKKIAEINKTKEGLKKKTVEISCRKKAKYIFLNKKVRNLELFI